MSQFRPSAGTLRIERPHGSLQPARVATGTLPVLFVLSSSAIRIVVPYRRGPSGPQTVAPHARRREVHWCPGLSLRAKIKRTPGQR